MWRTVDAVLRKRSVLLGVYTKAGSGSEISKMAVGREQKTEMSRYLPKNTKTGDFNTQRTLSWSFFVIPERLASIRAVVLAFTANKQTNKRTLSIIYTSRDSPPSASFHCC